RLDLARRGAAVSAHGVAVVTLLGRLVDLTIPALGILERRDAQLLLLDRAEDLGANLVVDVDARDRLVLRLPRRRLHRVADEVVRRVLDALAVLVDGVAEVLRLLHGELLRARELV